MTSVDWEKALANDYCHHRWAQLLEPLCSTFQAWKAGKIGYDEVDRALDEAYRQKCALNDLVCQRTDSLTSLIQWRDREWFEAWVEEHRPGR